MTTSDKSRIAREPNAQLPRDLAPHLAQTPLGMMQWDSTFHMIHWSSRCEQIFGWTQEEVIGRHFDDWRFVYEPDTPLVSEVAGQLTSGELHSNHSVNRNYTKDGRVITCEWFNSAAFDDDGQFRSIFSFVQDITEQQNNQRELRRRQKILEESQRQGRVGTWQFNPTTGHVTWSDEVYRIYGITRGDVEPSFDMVLACTHEADRDTLERALDAVWEGSEISAEVHIRMRARDDRERVVWGTIGLEIDENGERHALIGLIQDITDRQRAEDEIMRLNRDLEARVEQRTAELFTSEKRYRAVVETQEEIITRFDASGAITFVNPAFCRAVGRPEDELLKQQFLSFTPSSEREELEQWFKELLAAGRSVEKTHQVAVANDRTAYYHWLIAPVKEYDGWVAEWQAVGRDITRQRETEEQLRLVQSAIENTTEAVLITDGNLDLPGPTIIYVNPGFVAMTGYSAKEVIGKTPRFLQGEKTDQRVLARLKKHLRSGRTFRGEVVNYRKDGTPYEVEWNIQPIRDETGEVTRWVSVQRDVTELRQRQEELRQHRDELAHVARITSLGEMASGLAHELNQPLTASTTYLQGVLRKLESEAEAKGEAPWLLPPLQKALGQTQRAAEIISGMRRFITKRDSHREEILLTKLIEHVITLLESDANDRRVHLDWDVLDPEASVWCDPIQIEQILINFVQNAIDAVQDQPKDRRRVHIEAFVNERGATVISVSDMGTGVSEELVGEIFNPYITTKEEGIGLGLTISSSIAEAHGGRIRTENNEHGGATFVLTLPPGENGSNSDK